jgi:3-dehydroquinate dehydratase-2
VKQIWVIHGPNLNLLGKREPEIYGSDSLHALNRLLVKKAKARGLRVVTKQSNHEGDLIDFIQEAGRKADGLLINPGGYTHTSVAIRDALKSLKIPTAEVHLSNPMARESFRRRSLISAVVTGTISGFGPESYLLGLQALANRLKAKTFSKG